MRSCLGASRLPLCGGDGLGWQRTPPLLTPHSSPLCAGELMQLRSQHFKARAAESLANPHLRQALSGLRERMVVGRAHIRRRAGQLRADARGRQGGARRRARASGFPAGGIRAQRHRARGSGALGRDAAGHEPHRAGDRPARQCAQGDQVQVDARGGVRPQPPPAGGRHRGARDRPGRVHHRAVRRRALPHHRAGDPPYAGRGGRPVPGPAPPSAQDRYRAS